MSFIRRAKDNYFVINGRPSTDWGITISCDSAFNGAERDVETVTIPGRDGDLLMDKGRFKNIAVTYNDCLIESDFTAEFDSFRAYISSLRGYVRLEDTFHPEEYRMAYLGEGIKVDRLGTRYHSGVFDVTFTCLPQRFYKSGEEAISIPVAPAQTPATARRYWRLSAFTETQQETFKFWFGKAGHSEAEINAMQFEIIRIPDPEFAWLQTLTGGHVLEVVGGVSDRFMMALMSSDPTTDGTGLQQFLDRPQIKLDAAAAFQTGNPVRYIILQKSLGTEIYYAGRKIAQDETYQFGTIVNPTRFAALPKIRITLPNNLSGLSGATVYMAGIGQSGVAIKWADALSVLAGSTVTIDTELMDVYVTTEDNVRMYSSFISLNPYAKFFGGRIELDAGENTIRLDPMVAGCEIIPRWWEI